MSEEVLEGGCQCGAVRYRISGSPVMTALCHCTMCRRANAAPAVAWAMYEEAQVSFPDATPTVYESLHYWDSERLPWVEFADHLPRYAEFPPTE